MMHRAIALVTIAHAAWQKSRGVDAVVFPFRSQSIAILNIDGGAMRTDTWGQVLDTLAAISRAHITGDESARDRVDAAHEAESPIARLACKCLDDVHMEARIHIIERLSPTRVVVCWCDATTGRYGEQPWKLGAARNKSVCALSGATIRRGDKVYRPYTRGQRKPVNADQSILASMVADI
jgi:hypothetical protein